MGNCTSQASIPKENDALSPSSSSGAHLGGKEAERAIVAAIMVAALEGRAHDLKRLLVDSPGADLSSCEGFALRAASHNGHTQVVQLLLSYPNADVSAHDHRSLRDAAGNGHERIVEMLLNHPSSCPSAADNDALVQAAANGHTGIVRMLLKCPDVDAQSRGNAAFIGACANGHLECVKLLLPVCDPAARDNDALICAAGNNHAAIVKVLLQHKDVDPNAQQCASLKRAAWWGHGQVLVQLLRDSRVHSSFASLQDFMNLLIWSPPWCRGLVRRLIAELRHEVMQRIQHTNNLIGDRMIAPVRLRMLAFTDGLWLDGDTPEQKALSLSRLLND